MLERDFTGGGEFRGGILAERIEAEGIERNGVERKEKKRRGHCGVGVGEFERGCVCGGWGVLYSGAE